MVGHSRDQSALTYPRQPGLREQEKLEKTRRRRDLGLRKLVDQMIKLLFIRHRRLVPAYATSERMCGTVLVAGTPTAARILAKDYSSLFHACGQAMRRLKLQ